MSLLLEALKKAEKAKEEAQRRAREGGTGGEPEQPRGASETPASEPPSAPSAPVVTRDKLPPISQKLEILSDDLDRPTTATAPGKPSEPEAPAPSAREEPQRAPTQEASRASARKVFEAKFREPNPRLPFYITLGVLGAFGAGTFIYFWIQLRPPAPLVNANPPRQAEDVASAPGTGTSSPGLPAPAASASSTGVVAIPGLPGAAPAPVAPPSLPATVAAPSPAPRIAPPAAPETVAQKPAVTRQAPRVAPPPEPQPASPRPAPSVPPKVESAYAAYLGGDLATARADYQQALAEDPSSRDALLGLAAVDVRSGRLEAAEAAYARLLQAEPRNAEALAALAALRGARVDPLAAESRLKSLLAADPGAYPLNFALGNQLAQQGRWAEAQAQYFKAFAAEPDNADFAYNLAVALDHLRQSKLAVEYYQRAISLARTRGATFDTGAAAARAAQLAR